MYIDVTEPNSTQKINTLHIPMTWWAPPLAHNLISIRQLANLGIESTFKTNGTVELKEKHETKAYANTINKHYFLCSTKTSSLSHFQILLHANLLTSGTNKNETDPK